jgi:FMN phosphatase YigB (HAD superfamily)
MTKIKNLLFDLGGVLLNIDYHKTADAFKQLGVTQFDDLYSQAGANELFEALETGHITEEYFYTSLQTYCQPNTSQQQIEAAWNAMLLDFRPDSLRWLTAQKEQYNCYLLSNTNSIHLKAFGKIFEKEMGQPALDDYFIKAYYSHTIQQRKPYPETYQFVLNDAGLLAQETLFIDDSINNIEGAKKAGLQVHHLLHGTKIEQMIL